MPGHPPRLVLTAALRVDTPPAPDDEASAETPPAPRVLDRLRRSAANVSELSAVRPAPPLTRKAAESGADSAAMPPPLFLHRLRKTGSETEDQAAVVPAAEDDPEPDDGSLEAQAASEDTMAAGTEPPTAEDTRPEQEDGMADLDEDLIAALSDPAEEIDLDDNTDSEPIEAELGDASIFADDDAQVIDEETLRVMVAEMVREELMGELGGRITRNVRKLVRREIQRALLSQDFE